VVDEVSWIEN
jgi:hypothetical protein